MANLSAALHALTPRARRLYCTLLGHALAQGRAQVQFTVPLTVLDLPASDEGYEEIKSLAREIVAANLEWTAHHVDAKGRTATIWTGTALLSSFTVEKTAGAMYAHWSLSPSLREVVFNSAIRIHQEMSVIPGNTIEHDDI